MKKVLLAGIVGVSLLTASCSGVKNASDSQNMRKDFLAMKGDWEIVSVDYDKTYKIKPFDEGADIQCFVGSHWRLIPNNYTGAYTINGGGNCPVVTQPIKFEVKGGNEFLFKKIAEGTKAKQNTVGYSVRLINQTTDQFSLEQNVPFDGTSVRVVYNFQRTGVK